MKQGLCCSYGAVLCTLRITHVHLHGSMSVLDFNDFALPGRLQAGVHIEQVCSLRKPLRLQRPKLLSPDVRTVIKDFGRSREITIRLCISHCERTGSVSAFMYAEMRIAHVNASERTLDCTYNKFIEFYVLEHGQQFLRSNGEKETLRSAIRRKALILIGVANLWQNI